MRSRVLNASNARTFNLGFANDRSFRHVATDAGLLASPYETDRLLVAPSERVEIVVAFRPGESVVLGSHATGLDGGPPPRAIRRR